MSNTDAVKLHNELNHLSSATDRRDDFHRFLAQAAAPRQLPIEVGVEGGAIVVRVLGHEIAAVPRPVKIEDEYAIEYDFRVPFEGVTLSIWRAYLSSGGVLTEGPRASSQKVSDFNNQYVKQHIAVAVTSALLNSVIFSPASHEAAS